MLVEPRLLLVYAKTAIGYGGTFIPFTFLASIVTDISGFSAAAVGWVMLDRRSGIPVRASGPVPVGH